MTEQSQSLSGEQQEANDRLRQELQDTLDVIEAQIKRLPRSRAARTVDLVVELRRAIIDALPPCPGEYRA
jgi:hypothetical protein